MSRVSSELTDGKITASLEPLKAKISALTQSVNQLILLKLAQTTLTAGPRTHRPQSESPIKRNWNLQNPARNVSWN